MYWRFAAPKGWCRMMNNRDNRFLPCEQCRPVKHDRHLPPWYESHGHGCDMRPWGDNSMSMKLFCKSSGCARCDVVPAAPPVMVVNPWNCCDKAVVYLGIDECGNLVVSVRRDKN